MRREAERAWINRTSGNWAEKQLKSLSYPATKDGQQQFHGLDMWGKGVDRGLRDAAQPRPEPPVNVSGLVSDTYLTAPRLLVREGAGLIQLRVPNPDKFVNRVVRGKITEFSHQADRNFRKVLASVLNSAWSDGLMATLTYPVDDIDLSDWHVYKRHLDRFTKAFRRRYPNASAFWRLEFTLRGFPHYHLIIFGIPNTEAALQAYKEWHDFAWFSAVGTGLQKHLSAGCNVERVKSVEGARNYVAKYLSKQGQQCEGFTGRYWGKINKKMIPMAPQIESILTERQSVLLGRVFRDLVEKQVNGRRWKRALKECCEKGERGWTRQAAEYGRTLVGKAGEAVLLLTEIKEGSVYLEGKSKKGTFTIHGSWHHYFPYGFTVGEVLKGERGVVSDRMTPRNLKVPKKYRLRRNHSATYFGDASKLGAQLQQYLSTCDAQPEYCRPMEHRLRSQVKPRG